MRLIPVALLLLGCTGEEEEDFSAPPQQAADCTQRIGGRALVSIDGLDAFLWQDDDEAWHVTWDGGDTFEPGNPPGLDLGGGVLLGTIGGVLHRSTDGGETFTPVADAPSGITQLDQTGSAAFLVAGEALYRSTDAGLTWTLSSFPDLAHVTFGTEAFYGWGRRGSDGWQESSDELLRSLDDGDSWEDLLPRDKEDEALAKPLPFDEGVAAWLDGVVSWLPVEGFAAGGICDEYGVLTSKDHGETWTFVNPIGRCGGWFSELVYGPDGRLWVALPFDGYNNWISSTDGGLIGSSEDLGLTWTWFDPVAGTWSGMSEDDGAALHPRELQPLDDGRLIFAFGGDVSGGNRGPVEGWCITGGDETGSMTLPD